MLAMLATKGDVVPRGEQWIHEVKWDGVRIIAEGGRLFSRNGIDRTIAYPEIAGAASAKLDLVADGEIIALNEHGVPDFRVLAERMHVSSSVTAKKLAAATPVIFMVFDVLSYQGRDLTGEAYSVRREVLEAVRDSGAGLADTWQVPAVYQDGAMLFEATKAQGLEGIVSKRRSSRYMPGERSGHWLKFAHRLTGSYLVGGWRPQTGTEDRLAALLIGTPSSHGLRYRGRVGSGIGPKVSRHLAAVLAGISRADSPFDEPVPREDAEGTRWVEPVLVVEVAAHPTAKDDRLRQPSFLGIRSDLTPGDLLVEAAEGRSE